jgi:restriction endonuclease S subunit
MKERWLQNPSEEASSVLKCVQKAKALRQSQKGKLSTSLEEDHNKGLPFKIASNWVLVSLDDIASKIHYGYTSPAVFENTQIRLLRITDIQDDKVNWDNVPGCLIDDDTAPSYLLHRGDLLVARTGGTIGKTFLVKELPQPTVFASYLIRIVPNECVNPDFLKLFADSPLYWNQLYERCKGAGQPNVNATSLKALKIPLPPLPEQQRIVEILDNAFDGIAAAKTKTERKLEALDELKKSLLHQVFSGQL